MTPKQLVKLSNIIGITAIILLVYWVFTFITIEVFGLKNKLLPSFEHVGFLPHNKALIATENGFSLYDKSRTIKKTGTIKNQEP